LKRTACLLVLPLLVAALPATAVGQARESEAFSARLTEFQAFRAELGTEIATLSLLRSSFESLEEMARDAASRADLNALPGVAEVVVVPEAIRERVCADAVTGDWCALLPDRFREPWR